KTSKEGHSIPGTNTAGEGQTARTISHSKPDLSSSLDRLFDAMGNIVNPMQINSGSAPEPKRKKRKKKKKKTKTMNEEKEQLLISYQAIVEALAQVIGQQKQMVQILKALETEKEG